MLNLRNGLRYNFNTIAPSILGQTYTNVLLEGSVTYRIASKYNVDHTQASLLPYLPDGVSRKHTDYNYYIFRTETGSELILAYEWIREESIVENTDSFLDIRIQGASIQDIRTVKSILGYAGFNTVSPLT